MDTIATIARGTLKRQGESMVSNWIKFSWAWGKHFFATLHRDAALDSIRNVLAVIGAGTLLADFGTMRLWMAAPLALLLFTVWMIDYQRHFRGESAEESCFEELQKSARYQRTLDKVMQ